MSGRYEPWAGRVVRRDEQGRFAETAGQSRFVQRISARIGQQRGESDDYKMQHQPPDREFGAPMHDPEMMAPDLMAHPEYYATGDRPVDREAMAALRKAVAGGPDTQITVYRAAVAGGGIAPTNWVTTSRAYAEQHAGDDLEYRIFSRKVRAGDLIWEGNSIAEWGWVPEQGFAERTVRRTSAPGTAEDFTARVRQQHPDVKLDLHGKPGGKMVLGRIVVPERSRGTGTAIMSDLVAMADRTGTTLALTPSNDFGGSKTRLITFYKRFGFVENKGHNKDYEISTTMYRVPR